MRRGAAVNDLGIIADGSVLIRDGKIISVGPARRIENLKEARGAIEISAEGTVVMPGFVDPGIQLSFQQKNGIEGSAKRRKMADFCDESLSLMRACLQHGTLKLQVKACAGTGDLRADYAVLRHLAEIGDNPVGMVRSWRVTESAASAGQDNGFDEVLGNLVERKLVHFIEAAPECSPDFCERVWDAAAAHRLRVNAAWTGGRALAALIERSKAHAVWCPVRFASSELDVLSASHSIAVFSPGADLLDDSAGDCVRRLADAGGAIALCSGYHPSDSPSFNMQMVVALAVLRLHLTIEQAIIFATINAAHALGRGDVTGSIECGKQADLIVLNIPDYRELHRRLGINHVGMALRDGNIVFNRIRSKASGI